MPTSPSAVRWSKGSGTWREAADKTTIIIIIIHRDNNNINIIMLSTTSGNWTPLPDRGTRHMRARTHVSRRPWPLTSDHYIIVTPQSVVLSTDSRDGTTRVRKRLSGVDQRDARTPRRTTTAAGRQLLGRRDGWGKTSLAAVVCRRHAKSLGLVVDRHCSTRPSAHSSPIGLRQAPAQSFSCCCNNWQRVGPPSFGWTLPR